MWTWFFQVKGYCQQTDTIIEILYFTVNVGIALNVNFPKTPEKNEEFIRN